MNHARINELHTDEIIWIIFISISVVNIIGDEIEKNYCLTQDANKLNTAKNIFTLTLFSSLLIYCYIVNLRYKKYQKNKNNDINQMRLFASILVVTASAIYLYCQLKDRRPPNPTIL